MKFIDFLFTTLQTALKLVNTFINKSGISFHVCKLLTQNLLPVLNESISISTKDNLLCKLFFSLWCLNTLFSSPNCTLLLGLSQISLRRLQVGSKWPLLGLCLLDLSRRGSWNLWLVFLQETRRLIRGTAGCAAIEFSFWSYTNFWTLHWRPKRIKRW